MAYERWDVGTGNCIGRYATVREATARVRALLDRFGETYADDLELGEEDDAGRFHGTRTGDDLRAWIEMTTADGANPIRRVS